MLGFLIIYWIGKWHYKLAEKHGKIKWLYAVLGVVIYYGITLLSAFTIVFVAAMNDAEWVYTVPEQALGLIGIPFGLAATWGFRAIMKKQWEKEVIVDRQLLDDDLI